MSDLASASILGLLAQKVNSKSRNCPFTGWKVRGRAHTVIVGGQVKFTRE